MLQTQTHSWSHKKGFAPNVLDRHADEGNFPPFPAVMFRLDPEICSEPRTSTLFVAGLTMMAFACSGGTTASGPRQYLAPEVIRSQVGSLSENFGNEQRRRFTQSVPAALAEIRRRAALTWDDLAAIFQVSRRAVHLWASGEKLSAESDAKVQKLHAEAVSLGHTHAHDAKLSLLSIYGVDVKPARTTRRQIVNPGAILETDPTPIGSQARVGKRYPRAAGRRA